MKRPPAVVLVVQLFRVLAREDALAVTRIDRAPSRFATIFRAGSRHATPRTNRFGELPIFGQLLFTKTLPPGRQVPVLGFDLGGSAPGAVLDVCRGVSVRQIRGKIPILKSGIFVFGVVQDELVRALASGVPDGRPGVLVSGLDQFLTPI